MGWILFAIVVLPLLLLMPLLALQPKEEVPPCCRQELTEEDWAPEED